MIDNCPNLKAIARGGVGLDNVDVDYAKSKGIAVINTPATRIAGVLQAPAGQLARLLAAKAEKDN